MELKWIKLYADLFQHRKIDYISSLPEGDTLIVIWIKLLCLAGKLNNGGMVYLTEKLPYSDEMLANAFRKPKEMVAKALNLFEDLDMISRENRFIYIENWEKYQAVEQEDKIREQTRKRVAEYKKRKKMEGNAEGNVSGNVTGNAKVTQGNAIEEEIEKEIEEEKDIRVNTTFVDTAPVSLKEVEEYVKENKIDIDVKKFHEYYSERDWKDIYGNKVKDWKKKVGEWANREKNSKMAKKKKPDFVQEPIEDLTHEQHLALRNQFFEDARKGR